MITSKKPYIALAILFSLKFLGCDSQDGSSRPSENSGYGSGGSDDLAGASGSSFAGNRGIAGDRSGIGAGNGGLSGGAPMGGGGQSGGGGPSDGRGGRSNDGGTNGGEHVQGGTRSDGRGGQSNGGGASGGEYAGSPQNGGEAGQVSSAGQAGSLANDGCALAVTAQSSCEAALDMSCCVQQKNCAGASQCKAFIDCVATCEKFPDCRDYCALNNPQGMPPAYSALVTCGDVLPNCISGERKVRLSVSGIAKAITFMLNEDAASAKVVTSDGDYDFPRLVRSGQRYSVRVMGNAGSDCVVLNAFGIAPEHDIVVTARCGSGVFVPGAEMDAGDFYGAPIAARADGTITGALSTPAYSLTQFRVNATHTLDASFIGAGLHATDWQTTVKVVSLVDAADGSLVGVGNYAAPSQTHVGIWRWLSNGAPDTSFDTDGFASIDWYGGLGDTISAGGVIDAQGRIFAAATTYDGAAFHAGVARLTLSGALDATFGTAGRQLIPNLGRVTAIAAQNERLIIAGAVSGDNCGATLQHCDSLLRLLSDGSVDPSFASGPARDAFQNITALAVLADGSLVAAGYERLPSNWDFPIVAKFTADGALLAKQRPAYWPYLTESKGIAFQGNPVIALTSNGKILVSGNAITNSGGFIYLTRLNADLSFDASLNGVGSISANYSRSSGGPSSLVRVVSSDMQDPRLIGAASAGSAGDFFYRYLLSSFVVR